MVRDLHNDNGVLDPVLLHDRFSYLDGNTFRIGRGPGTAEGRCATWSYRQGVGVARREGSLTGDSGQATISTGFLDFGTVRSE